MFINPVDTQRRFKVDTKLYDVVQRRVSTGKELHFWMDEPVNVM